MRACFHLLKLLSLFENSPGRSQRCPETFSQRQTRAAGQCIAGQRGLRTIGIQGDMEDR